MMQHFVEFKALTLGEAILIVLTAGIPLSVAIVQRLRRGRLAFSVKMSAHAMKVGTPEIIHLRIQARVSVTLERFNIRFVENRWLGLARNNAARETIEVHQLPTVEWRVPYSRPVAKQPDGAGGWDVVFEPPKTWVAGDLLDIDIHVMSHKRWFGELSFEAVTTERRIYARGHFCAA